MFLDTSALIELLRQPSNSDNFSKAFKEITHEPMYFSVIQLGEFSDWCSREGLNVADGINIVKRLVNVVPVNEDIVINASGIKKEMREKGLAKFSLIDGIVVASARELDEKILTFDSDYRKIEGVVILR